MNKKQIIVVIFGLMVASSLQSITLRDYFDSAADEIETDKSKIPLANAIYFILDQQTQKSLESDITSINNGKLPEKPKGGSDIKLPEGKTIDEQFIALFAEKGEANYGKQVLDKLSSKQNTIEAVKKLIK